MIMMMMMMDGTSQQQPIIITLIMVHNTSIPSPNSCGCTRIMLGCPLVTVVIALLAMMVPLLHLYSSLLPTQLFAIVIAPSAIAQPEPYYSRSRLAEYSSYDRYFFQWWNFLIFDAESKDHFNVIMQLTNFSSKCTESEDEAYVAYAHGKGSNLLAVGRDSIPLHQAKLSKHFDLELNPQRSARSGLIPYSLTVLDDNTYNLKAEFTADRLSNKAVTKWDFTADRLSNKAVTKWDLTFHRIQGLFTGEMQEQSNRDFCTIVSYLFAYNSYITGYLIEDSVIYNFTDSSRYRAYAAGSYGCQLPNGSPAHLFPWTWFWLVIPGEGNNKAKDIGIVMGSARFQTGFPLFNIWGATAAIGLGSNIVTAQRSDIWHNSPAQLPFTAATTDGILQKFTVETDNWAQYEDAYGTAEIPLTQIYHIETSNHSVHIHWNSTIEQYFRAPVNVESQSTGGMRVFSDFRAVGVRAAVRIVGKPSVADGSEYRVLFEGIVDTLNALEYAYEPTMDIRLYKQHTQKNHS
jgi:hypothetical protein